MDNLNLLLYGQPESPSLFGQPESPSLYRQLESHHGLIQQQWMNLAPFWDDSLQDVYKAFPLPLELEWKSNYVKPHAKNTRSNWWRIIDNYAQKKEGDSLCI
jgi:RNAse (barnase) inhibitor barstar